MANFLTVEDLVQLAAGSCNRNFHRMLDTIRVLVARILDRVQPLDRLVAATVCYLLRKDFAVDAEPLKSLFHESSAEGLKWLWVLGATINKAARMASWDYLGVLDHDDELDTLTLFEYVKTINEHPDADCIYCDEDKINEQDHTSLSPVR